MRNKLTTYLGSLFGGLVVLYLLLVIGTIYLASEQTELLGQVSDKEASIGMLESKYYTSIAALNDANPAALGFAVPTQKSYARAASGPALTRADY
jgi:hypothetical protein